MDSVLIAAVTGGLIGSAVGAAATIAATILNNRANAHRHRRDVAFQLANANWQGIIALATSQPHRAHSIPPLELWYAYHHDVQEVLSDTRLDGDAVHTGLEKARRKFNAAIAKLEAEQEAKEAVVPKG